MHRLILRIIFTLGRIFGRISKIIPYKFFYPIRILKEGYYTERLKKYFKQFGIGNHLSPNMLLINPQHVEIGNRCHFESRVIIETHAIDKKMPFVKIGDDCSFGEFTHITCCNKIIIGNGLLTGRYVLLTDNSHGNSTKSETDIMPKNREIFSKGGIIIGDNVWIGDKVTILPNVKIGDSCIIGANSVVSNDIPNNVVVAGIPAKIIKNI